MKSLRNLRSTNNLDHIPSRLPPARFAASPSTEIRIPSAEGQRVTRMAWGQYEGSLITQKVGRVSDTHYPYPLARILPITMNAHAPGKTVCLGFCGDLCISKGQRSTAISLPSGHAFPLGGSRTRNTEAKFTHAVPGGEIGTLVRTFWKTQPRSCSFGKQVPPPPPFLRIGSAVP